MYFQRMRGGRMFYYYATTHEKTINFEREATAEEFNLLEPHISKISKMLVDKRRINIVSNAYKKVTDEFDKLMNGSKPPHDSEELIFSLTFYLAAFKKYLDNWEKHLKRTFGKDSREAKLFKSAQNYEYDNHMEYRIFYRLRNYDQHCDNFVSRITGRILPNESHEYLVLADRDRLLNNFDEWKPEEIAYLQSCDKYFDIRPLLNIFQNCIISIHEKIMQIHFNQEFFCSCATIVAAAKEFENEDTVHFIGVENEIDWTNLDLEGNPFNFTYLEVPVCKNLLEVYFLNNRKSVKIFYHGTKLKQRLGNFAFEINQEKLYEVAFSQLPFVDVCGQRMIRLCSKALLDKDEVYCVLADSRFPRKEQSDLCTTWEFLLECIVKD